MSEKQLTVAELLARSGKDGKASSRRRRRSLEEGGVSVAELTGRIPRVDAKPESGKHNTDSIDEPAAPVKAAKPAAEAPESPKDKAQEATTASEAKKAESTEVKAPKETEKTPEAKKAEPAPEAKKPEEATKAPDAKEEAKKPVASAPAKPVVKRADETTPKAPSKDDTVVLSVVDENEPVRLTTGSFPAVTKEQKEAAAEADTKDAAKAAPAAADSKVTEPDATTVIPVVKDADLDKAKATEPAKDEEPELAEDEEYVYEEVEYEEGDDIDDDAEVVEYEEDYEDEEWDDEESVSIGAVIGMALAGIILGVLVFKGFEMLWGSLNRGVVAALAVAVTVAMVGVIHVLRTNRDRFSMALAAIVGLVMTFGPLLTIS